MTWALALKLLAAAIPVVIGVVWWLAGWRRARLKQAEKTLDNIGKGQKAARAVETDEDYAKRIREKYRRD